MRMKCLATVFVAVAAFGLAAPRPAAADGMPSEETHRAVHHARHAEHESGPQYRGLWPGGPDPYAYSYERKNYYPFYNSRYWVPRAEMRNRTHYPNRLPGYWSSWGYPLSCKLQGRRQNCGVPYERRTAHHR